MSKNHRAIHYTREVIKESISNNKIKAKNSSLTGACLAEQERKGDFQSTDLDFHGAWCIGPCWGFLQPCCRGWWYGIHTLWGNAEAHLHPQWCCRPQLQEKPEGHKLWLYHPWVNTIQQQGHLLLHLLPDRISDHFLGEAAKELTPPEKSGRVDDHVHTWHRTWFFFFPNSIWRAQISPSACTTTLPTACCAGAEVWWRQTNAIHHGGHWWVVSPHCYCLRAVCSSQCLGLAELALFFVPHPLRY